MPSASGSRRSAPPLKRRQPDFPPADSTPALITRAHRARRSEPVGIREVPPDRTHPRLNPRLCCTSDTTRAPVDGSKSHHTPPWSVMWPCPLSARRNAPFRSELGGPGQHAQVARAHHGRRSTTSTVSPSGVSNSSSHRARRAFRDGALNPRHLPHRNAIDCGQGPSGLHAGFDKGRRQVLSERPCPRLGLHLERKVDPRQPPRVFGPGR